MEDYGASEDPAELKAQVLELRLQLENQTRVAQSLLGRHVFPSNLVSTPVHTPTDRHAWPGTAGDGHSLERRRGPGAEQKGGGDGEEQRLREELDALSQELERERSLNRKLSEQQRSRSASPARYAHIHSRQPPSIRTLSVPGLVFLAPPTH